MGRFISINGSQILVFVKIKQKKELIESYSNPKFNVKKSIFCRVGDKKELGYLIFLLLKGV